MEELIDLHCHLSGAIPNSGFRLSGKMLLTEYLQAPFSKIEQAQASAEVLQRDINLLKSNLSGYTEIRFNALRRINHGLPREDLVRILKESSSDRLKFILTLSREDGLEQYDHAEQILAEGVFSGVDLAGIEIPHAHEAIPFWRSSTLGFFKNASSHVGIAYHVGETGNWESVKAVIEKLPGVRIGHGLGLLKAPEGFLTNYDFSVEVCPTANVKTMTATIGSLREHVSRLINSGIKFCYNTDSPVFLETSIAQEYSIGETLVEGSSELSKANALLMKFNQ